VVLGNIGHRDKVQYTAIGDSVNVASRIEEQTKYASTSILISESMYIQIKDQVYAGKILNTELKGKKGIFKLYEIQGII
jgi:adenylate cyclase